MANKNGQKSNVAKPQVNATATPAKDAKQAETTKATTEPVVTKVEEKETKATVVKETSSKEAPKQNATPVNKPKVVKAASPEPPLVETEETTVIREPKQTVPGSANRLGRMSPDKLVDFCGQLNEMYIKPDTADTPIITNQVRIYHAYLSYIVQAQIEDDLQEFPSLQINKSDLNILQLAATALKTNIVSALPIASVAGEPEQMKIEFEKETPEIIKNAVKKENDIAKETLDLDPTKVRDAEELKHLLIHLLVRNNSSSTNIPEAVEWYRNHEIAMAPEEAKSVIMNTAKVDWFNAILNLLGDDVPMMLNGILSSIWRRYCVSDTILPIHFYVAKFAPSWSELEVREFIMFVCTYMSEKEPGAKKGETFAFLQNPSPEFIESVVEKAMQTTTPESNAIQNFFGKFIREKRVIKKDRVGAVIQHYCNLYNDQADQTKRLSLYKDMSAYSTEEPSKEASIDVPKVTEPVVEPVETPAADPTPVETPAEIEANKKK